MTTPWWSRPGLEVRDGRLLVAGRDAEAVAREHGTPAFAYDLVRIEERARALHGAFEHAGLELRLRLALKAQRDPAVLAFVRGLRTVGIDACSPGEVRHALEHGWAPERDLVHRHEPVGARRGRPARDGRAREPRPALAARPLGEASSGVDRRDPREPSSRRDVERPRPAAEGESLYAGARPTKFGILEEQLDDALVIAETHRLSIDTVHVHVGDGFLTDGLPKLEVAVERVARMARRVREAGHELVEVNAGGGLGVPQRPGGRAARRRRVRGGCWRSTSARSGSPSGASPATTSARSRACCSPRS